MSSAQRKPHRTNRKGTTKLGTVMDAKHIVRTIPTSKKRLDEQADLKLMAGIQRKIVAQRKVGEAISLPIVLRIDKLVKILKSMGFKQSREATTSSHIFTHRKYHAVRVMKESRAIGRGINRTFSRDQSRGFPF